MLENKNIKLTIPRSFCFTLRLAICSGLLDRKRDNWVGRQPGNSRRFSNLTMGEQLKEWAYMWGAKVKLPTDMPDDMLKDAIETSRHHIEQMTDFESQGFYFCCKISLFAQVYKSQKLLRQSSTRNGLHIGM